MRMDVGITGFAGTGSSAAQDYLKEFSNTAVALAEVYEHMAFLVPDSIFDLELKLYKNGDPLRSDEAIQRFLQAMEQLYEHDFTWFGSYKKLIGQPFMDAVMEYVNTIAIPSNELWYYRYKGTKFSLPRFIVQKGLSLLKIRQFPRFGYKNIYDRSLGYLSYVSHEEFMQATRTFTSTLMELMRTKAEYSLFDHLLWPKQCYQLTEFFEDELKMIIVKRDPRDLFIINKYYWGAKGVAVNFPMEATQFAKYYQNVMRLEDKKLDPKRVLVINFEDLVYAYEKTTQSINAFLGLDEKQHLHKKKYFDPARSMKNTQVFKSKKEWAEEVACFETLLADDLYDFKEPNTTSFEEMFV